MLKHLTYMLMSKPKKAPLWLFYATFNKDKLRRFYHIQKVLDARYSYLDWFNANRL